MKQSANERGQLQDQLGDIGRELLDSTNLIDARPGAVVR
jgi:hypothetical protein